MLGRHKIALFFFAAAALIYAGSLGNPFIWDDLILVRDNPQIKHFSNLAGFFTSALAPDPFSSKTLTIYYRPVQTLTYMCAYSIFGLRPWGFRLVNIFLHGLCALLAYRLIGLLTKEKHIAFISSLLFLVHPVHTEAVAYISGSADILAAVFLLLSLISYIRYVSLERGFGYAAMPFLSFIFALLSKEVALVLPLLIILYNLCFLPCAKKPRAKKALLGYATVAVVYIAVSYLVFTFHKTHLVHYKAALLWRILTAAKAFFIYLGLLVFPVNLHMERIAPIINSLRDLSGWLSLAAFTVLTFAAVKSFRSRKLLSFSFFWFTLNLFAVSGIPLRLNAVMAEHWLYIPSLGFFLAVAIIFRRIAEKEILALRSRRLLFIFILIIYSTLTIKQNRVWARPLNFYQRLIHYSPTSFKAYFNLGLLYQENKDYPRAKEYFSASNKLCPSQMALNQLGHIYIEEGLLDKAEAQFREILSVNPEYANAYNNLGNIYLLRQDYPQAVDFFKKAAALDKQNSRFHNNLGLAYFSLGNLEGAAAEINLALRLDPDNAQAENNLGNMYMEKGNYREAVRRYKKAVIIEPDFDKAHFNLGVAYIKEGFTEEARKEWEEALRINPGHAAARQNLKVLNK